jgi:hypothetical protein
LETENHKLEKELSRLTSLTQEQLIRKQLLEKENKTLEREQKLRQDLIQLRLERIQKAQKKRENLNEKQKQKLILQRKEEMESLLKEKGEAFLQQMFPLGFHELPSSSMNPSQQNADKVKSDQSVRLSGLLDPLDLDWSEEDFE